MNYLRRNKVAEVKQDSGFTSISVSKTDYAKYDQARKDFAAKHGIPVEKVSMAMIINTGMTFWIQRSKLGMGEEAAA
jgi:hypothetical protein